MPNTTKKTSTKAQSAKSTKPPVTRRAVVEAKLKNVASQNGFIVFIREQGIIGLAVGLAIGTAAGASVKVIVNELISPLVALLTAGVDLNSLKWVLVKETSKHAEVAIGWGAILSSLITLVATALVIYWLIHVAKLDRLDKKKGA